MASEPVDVAPRPGAPDKAAGLRGAADGIAAALVYVTAALAWVSLTGLPDELRRDVGYLLIIGAGTFAVGACLRSAGRLGGRQRVAWSCMAVFSGINVLGVTMDGFIEVVLRQPLTAPSLQDVAGALALPFAIVAMAGLVATYLRSARTRTVLDAVVVAAAVFCLVWHLALRDISGAQGPVLTTQRILLIMSPMADVICLLVVIGIILRTVTTERLSLYLIAVAIIAASVGDFAGSYFQLSSAYLVPQPFNALWITAYLFIGLGGWYATDVHVPAAEEPVATASRPAPTAGVMVAMSAAFIAVMLMVVAPLDRPLLWATSLVVVALVGRQSLVMGENVALTSDLGRRSDELHSSELRYRGLVQNASDVITVLNAEGVITYVSQSVKAMLGISAERLTGMRLADLVHDDDRTDVIMHLDDAARRRSGWPAMEFRIQHHNGQWRDIEAIPNNLLDDAAVAGIVLSARDVTDRRVLEHQLRQQAFHDPLTGLANRALLRERLEHALARCARSGESVALLFIDLDDFKTINDQHGHGAGDVVLRSVAARIRGALRHMDTPARLGGDEFAVLLEGGVDDHTAAMVAQRIIDDLGQPITAGDRTIRVSASIGLAIGGATELADNLLRQADVAMYRAKANGKGDYSLFHASMDLLSIARLQFEVDLQEALVRGHLVVHYQPIVDLESGAILGTEALVRWDHPTRGLLPPTEFIELAEESGQVIAIGCQVLSAACRQTQAWREELAFPDLNVSVNISSRHFRGYDLVGDVTSVLEETGLPPSALVLEVTESALLADLHDSRAQMAALKRLGVRIALDDFGTGYSSLGYLRELPVDILKIDQSFVVDLGRGDRPSEFIRAITTLGRSLELHAVAEGVEQVRQARLLRTLGVDSAQGFYFAKPAAADAVVNVLRKRRLPTGAARTEVRVAGGTEMVRKKRVKPRPTVRSGGA